MDSCLLLFILFCMLCFCIWIKSGPANRFKIEFLQFFAEMVITALHESWFSLKSLWRQDSFSQELLNTGFTVQTLRWLEHGGYLSQPCIALLTIDEIQASPLTEGQKRLLTSKVQRISNVNDAQTSHRMEMIDALTAQSSQLSGDNFIPTAKISDNDEAKVAGHNTQAGTNETNTTEDFASLPDQLKDVTAFELIGKNTDGQWVFDRHDKLKQWLCDEDLRELPVIPIVITGSFRKGKSLLLNLFVNMINSSQKSKCVDEFTILPQYFSFKHGAESHTIGVQAFPILINDDTGKKIYLFLDTQGQFDTHTDMGETSQIFAFSALVSSVLIYNLSMNIEEQNLDYLALFSDFAECAANFNSDACTDGLDRNHRFPYLLVVVRDWQWASDFTYGFDGGRRLLERRLEDFSHHSSPELVAKRSLITSLFARRTCCLLPHPGMKVARDSSFDGRFSDMCPTFLDKTRDLVSDTFKTAQPLCDSDGQHISASRLFYMMKEYVHVLQKSELQKPTSIFRANKAAICADALNCAIAVYQKKMNESFREDPHMHKDTFEHQHKICLRLAEDELRRRLPKRRQGFEDIVKEHVIMVEKEISKIYLELCNKNKRKHAWLLVKDFLFAGSGVCATVVGASASASIVSGAIVTTESTLLAVAPPLGGALVVGTVVLIVSYNTISWIRGRSGRDTKRTFYGLFAKPSEVHMKMD